MHTESLERWRHDHTFGQDTQKVGEHRTRSVVVITAVTMLVEIAAGMVFGSMALLADGLHMASHASALLISLFAYSYTRRHARDTRFNFGTGKVNSLAAFASATLLVVFALIMMWESVKRLASPVPIEFNYAILVAVLGLAVNGVCLLILGGHGHDHEHRSHDHHAHDDHAHPHGNSHDHGNHVHSAERNDHNLWSAYLHVLADALTSALAILALLGAKYLGMPWLDPLMGIVGAFLVTRWSWGLIRTSSGVLLDMRVPDSVLRTVRESFERDGDSRVSDLHVWAVGPAVFAAEIAVVTSYPQEPTEYAARLAHDPRFMHVTVEVHRCPSVAPTRTNTTD